MQIQIETQKLVTRTDSEGGEWAVMIGFGGKHVLMRIEPDDPDGTGEHTQPPPFLPVEVVTDDRRYVGDDTVYLHLVVEPGAGAAKAVEGRIGSAIRGLRARRTMFGNNVADAKANRRVVNNTGVIE